MSTRLKFRENFDWRRVAWGRPDSPRRDLCSYCHGALPEVPLMLWKENGMAMQLCDTCAETWITSEIDR